MTEADDGLESKRGGQVEIRLVYRYILVTRKGNLYSYCTISILPRTYCGQCPTCRQQSRGSLVLFDTLLVVAVLPLNRSVV